MKQAVEAEILKTAVFTHILELIHGGFPQELSGTTGADTDGFVMGVGALGFLPIRGDLTRCGFGT